MTPTPDPRKINLQAFTEAGQPIRAATSLLNLERLAPELIGLKPDLGVDWQALAEQRMNGAGQTDVWLHLSAQASVPLTCQRCMGAVDTPLQIDQWYRFVATEDIAMAQDDASEEDLLVITPQFDLLTLLEDELLLALPLVPMHEVCPVTPTFSAGHIEVPEPAAERPHAFAALAQLKKK